jgi:EAL domain-containing protein (putative c-di-GMP-specific phosphodiesterase class I)
MDDFGTGYSSLGYLKQFPFNTLKIDRSFVKDLSPTSQDLAIVNAIIALGKGLNLHVVAEGVETEEIKNLLKNMGCEYIQGYLFSKPLPAAEATKLLKNHHFI